MTNLIAFHGKSSVKKRYLKRVSNHIKADQIIKGKYWENGKGCAVGCTIHSSEHANYETELGIPEWLARVEDTLFEGLSNKEAETWPKRFLAAIKVGVDLEKAKRPFLLVICKSVLKDFDHKEYPKVFYSVETVIKLLKYKKSTSEQFLASVAAARAAQASASAYACVASVAAVRAARASAYSCATGDTPAISYAIHAYTNASATRYSFLSKQLIKILKALK